MIPEPRDYVLGESNNRTEERDTSQRGFEKQDAGEKMTLNDKKRGSVMVSVSTDGKRGGRPVMGVRSQRSRRLGSALLFDLQKKSELKGWVLPSNGKKRTLAFSWLGGGVEGPNRGAKVFAEALRQNLDPIRRVKDLRQEERESIKSWVILK